MIPLVLFPFASVSVPFVYLEGEPNAPLLWLSSHRPVTVLAAAENDVSPGYPFSRVDAWMRASKTWCQLAATSYTLVNGYIC